MSELLPCPFCGKQPSSKWQGGSVPGAEDCAYWGIDCCNAFAHADDEADAAAAWNTRSPVEGAVAWAWEERQYNSDDWELKVGLVVPQYQNQETWIRNVRPLCPPVAVPVVDEAMVRRFKAAFHSNYSGLYDEDVKRGLIAAFPLSTATKEGNG
jgi:hypothetical protein